MAKAVEIVKVPTPAKLLAGLTVTNCPSACGVDGCVISDKPYCAHPHKGGLQGADMGKESAIEMSRAAKKMLGKAKINLEKA